MRERLLRPGASFALVFAVAFALNAPYLIGGFSADDFLFLYALDMDPRPWSTWAGLWSVRDPEVWTWLDFSAFRALWWAEDGTMGTFFRPVFSWIFEGSVRVFGEVAWPLHLLFIAAHGAAAGMVVLLVRALSGRAGLALVAGLLFACCEDHSMGVGWIATGTDMLCLLFALVALYGHARWLAARRPGWMLLALASLLLALGSKESAAVVPVTMVLMSLLLPGGVEAEVHARALPARALALVRDWPAWAPATAILGLFLGGYVALGFGGMSSLLYLDPMADPVAWLAHAVGHLPVLWLATLSPFPPSLAMFSSGAVPWLAAGGLVFFALWVFLLRPFRHSGLAWWAMGWYCLTLLPQVSTDASERALYLPFVGAAVLLALLLVRLGRGHGRGARVIAWAVLLGIALPGAVATAAMPWTYLPSLSSPERKALTALPLIEAAHPERVVFLATSGMMDTFYVGGVLEHRLGHDLEHVVLSSCNAVVSAARTGDDTLVMRVDRTGWLSQPFARAVRSDWQLEAGRTYHHALVDGTLVQLTSDGTDALEVRFDLDLDDPGTLFLAWGGAGYEVVHPGEWALGEERELADTSDLWASMY